MDTEILLNGLILFALLGVFLLSGMWVAFALATAGIIGLAWLANGMQFLVGGLLFNALNDFTLVAVPMYVFMGELILKGGLSERLYRGAARITSVLPGGLVHSNIASCSVFAAISGSSIATTATIGSVALKEQISRGYDARLVMGSIAAGGTLGILIPPSITLLIYGAFQNVPVDKLFIGGIIPGILMAFAFSMWIAIAYFIFPAWFPKRARFTLSYFGEVFISLVEIWPFLFIMVAIMGGIYSGLVTASEAAAVGIVATMLILWAQGTLSLEAILDAGASTVRISAMILFIVVGARIFTTAMAFIKFPAELTGFVTTLDISPMLVWTLIVILYLILGCFMDGISMMLLTLPVTFPILILGMGFDPIWFGVILTVLIEIALITPPIGIHLFVLQGMAGHKSIRTAVAGSVPFMLLMLMLVAVFSVYPQIITWLPQVYSGR